MQPEVIFFRSHFLNDTRSLPMLDSANQRRRIIIIQSIREMMSILRHSPHATPRKTRFYAIIGIIALFALFVARSVSTQFPNVAPLERSATSNTALVSVISSHDQRPRFDCSGLQWSAPVNVFLPFPPSETSNHLTSPSRIFPALHVKGPHFNRPPPIA